MNSGLSTRTKRKWLISFKRLGLYILLLFFVVVFAAPFYWLFTASLKYPADIFIYPPEIIPSRITLSNFTGLFSETMFGRAVFNSVFVSSTYTLAALFFCSLAGFAFAKYPAPGRNLFFGLILATLMIPPVVTYIPLFIVMTRLGWGNTYQSVILPTVANAFGIFWMKQYISTIPDGLLEAARIDGCSEFRIYRSIVLPTIKPALSSLGIFLFMNQWNDFMWPLIILRSEEMYTIPVSLALLKGVYSIAWGRLMAGSAIATLPLVILFLVLQRQFIAGVMAGALKS